jgi:hypothetical protein
MIFELHPPQAAGPLRIGAAGHDTVEILTQLGPPQVFCRTPESRPAWGVHRPSGLFIVAYFDADDRLEAIEFGRPAGKDDTITHDGSTCSPRQRQTSSPNCDSAPPSTRKKTDTPSPHPACSCPGGGRSRRNRQTTKKDDSSKASSSRGLATTTSQPSKTDRAENNQSTGLDNCSSWDWPG